MAVLSVSKPKIILKSDCTLKDQSSFLSPESLWDFSTGLNGLFEKSSREFKISNTQSGFLLTNFLKAFLMYNTAFEIILFPDYLHKMHSKIYNQMPLCYKNTGGSLWMSKQ